MIGKRQLIVFIMLVAFIVFGVLNLDTVKLSAADFPAIYISPPYVSTEDPLSAIGANYTFSVYTDYNGSDVWGYEFDLTYNPLVLEVVEVVNGDLITEDDGLIMWEAGDFNNTEGTLIGVGNGFYYVIPPPPLVSGPGTLANVTFTVVGYGISNIAFVESETRLIGYDPLHPRADAAGFYNIIDEYWPYLGHIEGGVFDNLITDGDLDGDGDTDAFDLFTFAVAYESTPGDPNWNLGIADLNGDVVVDKKDLQIMDNNWG